MGPNERYAIWSHEINLAGQKKYNFTFNRRKLEDSIDFQKVLLSNSRKLSDPYVNIMFELLPAEPIIKKFIEIYQKKSMSIVDYREVNKYRKKLLDTNLVNYRAMRMKKYNDQDFWYSPYFLNELGKLVYYGLYGYSPDFTAMNFYADNQPSNAVYHVKFLELIQQYFDKAGHKVITGKFPYDLIVDNKHLFIITEPHENSIGIEMRLSYAIADCTLNDRLLYIPACSESHQRRINAIIAGILFYFKKTFSYLTTIEYNISENSKVDGWDMIYTSSRDRKNDHLFSEDLLPFPKVLINSNWKIPTQMNLFNQIGHFQFEHPKLSPRYIKSDFKYPMKYINDLKETEILPGVKVTVGLGHMNDIWWDMANGADLIITGKMREHVYDYFSEKPQIMMLTEIFKRDDKHHDAINLLRAENIEVHEIPRNHAKVILNSNKLLIHSQTTTNYMGNNRESFALIDFMDHIENEEIHETLLDMFLSLPNVGGGKKFTQTHNHELIHFFDDKIKLFCKNNKSKTIEWPYYKNILYELKKDNGIIYTSHMDMKNLAEYMDEIHIQATSRMQNFKVLKHAKCPVYHHRLWHPRIVFNSNFIGVGSWDFAQIRNQQEIQALILLDNT
ncbi:hypothetical protein [Methanosalsum zhilinae]|nr:hypothetical protein [Methanosalsum zhilinae]